MVGREGKADSSASLRNGNKKKLRKGNEKELRNGEDSLRREKMAAELK